MLKLLGYKRIKTKNLYRGSIHGWNAKDFHSHCDGKQPTISLFKVKDTGECIGGYTNAKWSTPLLDLYKEYGDSNAMLFNLTC